MKLENLKGHIKDSILTELNEVMTKFNINTAYRLSHFLGQCMHESGNFTALSENLKYSGDRLKVVFPKYFKDKNVSEYDHNAEKIGNLIYANRMGNSDVNSGDGYKYRGRGCIELTGKSNYELFGKSIGEDLVNNPDLISTKYPLTSAAWFFSTHNLNAISDKGISNDVITAVTKVINGGTNGLDQRIANTNMIYKLIA